MIQSVSLLQIWKEWILPVVTIFNTSISCLTTLLILKAIFERETWIKQPILSVLFGGGGGGIRNTNRTFIVLVHKDKFRQISNNFAGTSCKTIIFQYISYFKIPLHLARLKQYPKARPEYSEKSANLQHCQDNVDIVGHFYENEWKIILFWIHCFCS